MEFYRVAKITEGPKAGRWGVFRGGELKKDFNNQPKAIAYKRKKNADLGKGTDKE